MANTLRFKRGLLAGLPSAAVGEPLFTTDTFDLYIGTASGTQKYQKFIASGTTSQLLRGDGSLLTMPIVLTSPANGEVLKYNGTNWVNSSDAGITGSGVAGQVAYFTGATTQGGSNNLFWDATNNRLGIGTNTPLLNLQINSVTGSNSTLAFSENGVLKYYNRYIASTGAYQIVDIPSVTTRLQITSNGNVQINSTTDNGLRFQVTGDGYFSGSLGIGSTSLTGYGVRNSRTITGALACYGFSVDGTIQSDATSSINIFNSVPATQAAAFNIGSLIHFIANQGTQGAGSTISNQYGFLAQSGLTGATNNYGFFGNIASGTGRWNLYMNGTAANWINGNTKIGGTAGDAGFKLDVDGTMRVSGATTLGDTSSVTLNITGGRAIRISGSLFMDYATGGTGDFIFRSGAGFTERMRLDASGNLGLGVTPSAWGANERAFQLRGGGTAYNPSIAYIGGEFELIHNAFYNGTNYVYTGTGYGSTRLRLGIQGAFQFFTTGNVSGSAGATPSYTQAMTLDASGNLFIGATSGSNTAGFTNRLYLESNVPGITLSNTGTNTGKFTIGVTNGNFGVWNNASSNYPLYIFSNNNIGVSTNTDAGFRLDVNGTMRVSGASTFNDIITITKSQNAATNIITYNTTNGTNSYVSYQASSNSAGIMEIGKFSQTKTAYKSSASGDGFIYNSQYGDISILNDFASGAIKLTAGGSSTAHFTIASTGAATFSSSVQAGGTITIARGQDANVTNVNINSGVTPVSAFQINTDQPNLRSILMARNGYSLVLGTQDANRVTIDSTGAATFSSSVTAVGVTSSNRITLTGVATSELYTTDASGMYLTANTLGGMYLATEGTFFFRKSTSPFTEYLRITNTGAATFSGNVGIGGTPAQRLDVQGSANSIQARFGNVAGRGLTIGTSAISGTNDAGVVFNAPTATDGTLVFQTTSVERARISGSGNLLINTTSDTGYKLRVNGTSYFDDNLRFPNLKGCVFVQTGGSLLGSIAMDSANAVTIDNNGFAGLSVGGSYTMTGGNLGIGHSAFGTSATKTISVNSGTAPSTSPADAFQLYSADITAGNAAPHFRTENGGIIKLYQQTTGVTSATYIGGAGTTVTDLDTFDGYTIPQIVKALRNAGLLA